MVFGGTSTLHPPKCNWQPTRKYCCFLSHYKNEAGSDARYLRDLLQRMANAPVFLDSSDLADLKRLFTDGVQQSDVLVVLGTKGVLTRPWCILEIDDAARHDIPIVVVPIEGRGFSFDDAADHVTHLEERLEAANPGALAEIKEYIGGDPETLRQLKTRVHRAVTANQHVTHAARTSLASIHAVRRRSSILSFLTGTSGASSLDDDRAVISASPEPGASPKDRAKSPPPPPPPEKQVSYALNFASLAEASKPAPPPPTAPPPPPVETSEVRLSQVKVEERSTTRTVTHPQRGEITQTKVTRKVTYTEKQVKRVLHTRVMWHPNGSDHAVLADASDLLDRMGAVTGRSLEWVRPGHETLPSPKPRKTIRSLPWRRTSRGSDDFEEATSSGGVPTAVAAIISD